MQFKKWMKDNGFNQKDFASLTGVQQPTVSRWIHGHHRPSLKRIMEIEKITQGKVKVHDFIRCSCENEN